MLREPPQRVRRVWPPLQRVHVRSESHEWATSPSTVRIARSSTSAPARSCASCSFPPGGTDQRL